MTYLHKLFQSHVSDIILALGLTSDILLILTDFKFFLIAMDFLILALFLLYLLLLWLFKAHKYIKLNFFRVFIVFFVFINFFSVWLFVADDFETVYIIICIVLFVIAEFMKLIRYDTCYTPLWNTLVNTLNFIFEVDYRIDKAFSGIIKSLLAISGIFLTDISVYHMNQTTVELFGLIPMSEAYSLISVFLGFCMCYYSLNLIIFMLSILVWTFNDYYSFRKYID